MSFLYPYTETLSLGTHRDTLPLSGYTHGYERSRIGYSLRDYLHGPGFVIYNRSLYSASSLVFLGSLTVPLSAIVAFYYLQGLAFSDRFSAASGPTFGFASLPCPDGFFIGFGSIDSALPNTLIIKGGF
jgi:hypothetical protein